MRAYQVVDVFSDAPLLGNPVAVVLEAEGLSTDQMQAIARWTNLSETTFLLPASRPEADYALRIFTPMNELPFAGHPTLGSAHAALEAGRARPRDGGLVQECGVGLVRLSVGDDGRRLAFELPPASLTDLSAADVDELEAALGAPVARSARPALVNVGPVWLLAQLADAEAVLALAPDYAAVRRLEQRLGATGITVFGAHATGEAAIEVRSFAPSSGIDEDPVCGSGNGAAAVFQARRGLRGAGGYLATQGGKVGRRGRIAITIGDDGQVSVGGECVTTVEGRLAVG